jgi:hypothetical protein
MLRADCTQWRSRDRFGSLSAWKVRRGECERQVNPENRSSWFNTPRLGWSGETMTKSKFSDEQIVRILKESEAGTMI